MLMLHRQVEFSKDPAWAVRTLCQFSDILILVAESAPSWGRNILGAIGLGKSQNLFIDKLTSRLGSNRLSID